jgi:hypothetical protein
LSWEDGTVTDTLVTIEFRDLGRETEVVLTHERFLSSDWRDRHSLSPPVVGPVEDPPK